MCKIGKKLPVSSLRQDHCITGGLWAKKNRGHLPRACSGLSPLEFRVSVEEDESLCMLHGPSYANIQVQVL